MLDLENDAREDCQVDLLRDGKADLELKLMWVVLVRSRDEQLRWSHRQCGEGSWSGDGAAVGASSEPVYVSERPKGVKQICDRV